MAIYSPPVRLGGAGSMIFLPGSPQKPSPPAMPTADYLPGPWSIPFDADTTQPPPAAKAVFEQVEIMTRRFPTVGVSLCSTGSGRSDQDRKRLESVRTSLVQRGVRQIALVDDRVCGGNDDRPGPAVLIQATID